MFDFFFLLSNAQTNVVGLQILGNLLLSFLKNRTNLFFLDLIEIHPG